MLALTLRTDESAILDFQNVTEAELKLLRSRSWLVRVMDTRKGAARVAFDLPASVRIVRSSLLGKDSR